MEYAWRRSQDGGARLGILIDLIRNRETKTFLTEDGGWTQDPRKGREIHSITEAIAIAKHLQLDSVELFHAFLNELPSGEWDFATPLPNPA